MECGVGGGGLAVRARLASPDGLTTAVVSLRQCGTILRIITRRAAAASVPYRRSTPRSRLLCVPRLPLSLIAQTRFLQCGVTTTECARAASQSTWPFFARSSRPTSSATWPCTVVVVVVVVVVVAGTKTKMMMMAAALLLVAVVVAAAAAEEAAAAVGSVAVMVQGHPQGHCAG